MADRLALAILDDISGPLSEELVSRFDGGDGRVLVEHIIYRSRRALESDVARLPELSGWLSRRGSSVLCDIHNGDIRLGVRELSPGEARQRLGLEKIRYSQEAQI